MSAVTEQQAAAPAGEGLSPLRHVYLLDDLTGLIPTLPRARELGEEAVAEAVGAVRRCVLNVAGLIDLDHIAVELISWDHALAEFLARTPTLPAHDVAIVIGSGGRRFADQLEEQGRRLAGRLDVPAAKILSDSGDAFFSEHSVLSRDGTPLEVVVPSGSTRVLVVDDCVQTGGTLTAVAEAAGVTSGSVVTLVCNEFTRRRRESDGWTIDFGTLLPGETYPMSYATDLFCVRDFLVDTAVRFADGTSTSYSSGGDWLSFLHGTRAEEARSHWTRTRDLLDDLRLLDQI
ncbi:phosphoribosyltransferase [Streptomyces sp. NBC_01166]|uniref:phosphoribosyltransferase n=1 Tax=Streptomyces sp. NBC_01166 TaxID=2903755 RepID=UPI0038642783|nr:phosphoribosyltransferase [Streptomyces sp. NBC_01166]